jgi:hypothetical protein
LWYFPLFNIILINVSKSFFLRVSFFCAKLVKELVMEEISCSIDGRSKGNAARSGWEIHGRDRESEGDAL